MMNKLTRCMALWIALAVAAFSGSAAGASEDNLTANNVVIVLDASGSMSQKMRGSGVVKMDAAKKALKEVLKNVPADTQIGLLVFSGNNQNPWSFALGPRDDAAIGRAIDATMPGGGTPLGEFIHKAATALQQQRKKQMGYGTYRMLVVTDGQATDPQLMRMAVPQAIKSGVRMDVIGVDMQQTHALATQVHSYRRADDPQALKKAVADVFAEVSAGGGIGAMNQAFAELAPIPPEVAGKMLDALSKTVTINSNPASSSQPQPAAPGNNVSNTGSSNNSASAKDDGFQWNYLVWMAVFVVVVIIKLGKKRK